MMCDELDIAYESTQLVMGSTEVTPDQGGSGGSDAIERDGVAALTVSDGTIALHSDPSRKVPYATRVGGKRFNVALEGRNVDATGVRLSRAPFRSEWVLAALKTSDVRGWGTLDVRPRAGEATVRLEPRSGKQVSPKCHSPLTGK